MEKRLNLITENIFCLAVKSRASLSLRAFVAALFFLYLPAILLAQPMTDIDGNTYPTEKIGTQIWTIKNLEVTRFRNGDIIPEAKTLKKWDAAGNEGKPAWCYYNYIPANGIKYGKLYNWFAINDPRGILPDGWHIPGDVEWTILTDTLGGVKVAGTLMKHPTAWDPSTGNAKIISLTSGFNAIPGGICNHSGAFYGIGDVGAWWSSTWSREDIAWSRNLFYNSSGVSRDGVYKRAGLSVRCIKD